MLLEQKARALTGVLGHSPRTLAVSVAATQGCGWGTFDYRLKSERPHHSFFVVAACFSLRLSTSLVSFVHLSFMTGIGEFDMN